MNIEDFRQLAQSGSNPNSLGLSSQLIEEALRIRLVEQKFLELFILVSVRNLVLLQLRDS